MMPIHLSKIDTDAGFKTRQPFAALSAASTRFIERFEFGTPSRERSARDYARLLADSTEWN